MPALLLCLGDRGDEPLVGGDEGTWGGHWRPL